MKEYLVYSPAAATRAAAYPYQGAHLAYKISNGHLFRGSIALNLRGGIMVIGQIETKCESMSILANEIYNECLHHSFDGVVLGLSDAPHSDTAAFAGALCDALKSSKLRIYLPLSYSVFCENAYYLVPGAISGGSLQEYLETLIAQHGAEKLALELICLAMDFTMPSEKSEGDRLTSDDLQKIMENTGAMSFYSAELCSNYFTYSDPTGKAHFVMFDDARSIADKNRLAQRLGIQTTFMLFSEVEDILPEITSYR